VSIHLGTAFPKQLFRSLNCERLRMNEPGKGDCRTATPASFAVAVDAAALISETGNEFDATADCCQIRR
jgi:hypothetical protein